MKKLLLLLAAATAVTAANADVINIAANKIAVNGECPKETYQTAEWTGTCEGFTFAFKKGASSADNQAPAIWINGDKTSLRLYKGSEMTITAPAGTTMNGIVFKAFNKNAYSNVDGNITSSVGSMAFNNDEFTATWTTEPATGEVKITLSSSVNVKLQMNDFEIYTGADKPGGGTVTPPETYEATTVAELLNVPNKSNVNFEGALVVGYSNGPDCYVYDRTGATLLYSSKDDPWAETLAPGTVITEFSATRSDYNTTVEFIPEMNSLVTEGSETVQYKEITTASQLTTADVDYPVVLKFVSLGSIEEKNAVATFEDGTTVNLYNRFTSSAYTPVEYPEAAVIYDVYGIGSVYRDAAQVNFTSATPASSVKDIFTDGSIRIEGNSIVAPGARIYTVNGMAVEGNNLPAGIYVVRTADKAVKIIVK